jgi:hypothetical protein
MFDKNSLILVQCGLKRKDQFYVILHIWKNSYIKLKADYFCHSEILISTKIIQCQ